ncbi:MAG: hypothetical protein HC853_09775 [Anaerolineae bacterium]|nr:hypothetical protein [Anaerolineae bacterium]
MLGRALQVAPQDDSPIERGLVLRHLVQQAAQNLPNPLPGTSTDPQHLLNISFFQRNHSYTLKRLANSLNLAEKSYYRHRAEVIRLLAKQLHRQLQPAFHGEIVSTGLKNRHEQFTPLVGREDALQTILSQLRAGQPVALIGPSGIGKTTLAFEVVRQFSDVDDVARPVIWHTLRHGLTDHVVSLVFSLAYGLRQHGADRTWKQLIADGGTLKHEVIYGLLRFDLNTLQSQAPLICIDEVGVLGDERQEHLEIIDLLEELSSATAMLWVGQRLPLATTHIHILAGLSQPDTENLLTLLNMPLAPVLAAQLWQATRGNPALIKLVVALIRTGEEPTTAISQLGRTPSTEFVFHRIWRRLKANEQMLLMHLAAFQVASPIEAWADLQEALQQLMLLDLVREVSSGCVIIVPHIRDLTYERVPSEHRPALHLRAARIYEERGEYTSAMSHYLEGNQPAYGLWLWHAHRLREIEQGRGAQALASYKRLITTNFPTNATGCYWGWH